MREKLRHLSATAVVLALCLCIAAALAAAAAWFGFIAPLREQRERKRIARANVSISEVSNSKFTPQMLASVLGSIKQKNLPAPTIIELEDNDFLVATYDLPNVIGSERAVQKLAEKSLMAMWNATHGTGIAKRYRVTVNGPPPRPGTVLRYGSAGLEEGGVMEWNAGK
jgi:hypothetical protein